MAQPYYIILIVSWRVVAIAFEMTLRRLYPMARICIMENSVEQQCLKQAIPDLVILVDNLYLTDGLALTHALREGGVTAPILVISNDPALAGAIEETGARLLLRKPSLSDELQELLPKLLSA